MIKLTYSGPTVAGARRSIRGRPSNLKGGRGGRRGRAASGRPWPWSLYGPYRPAMPGRLRAAR